MTNQEPLIQETVYRRVADTRVRALPEWAGALVYTPSSPALCYLNTTTWAVLELCDGRTPMELEDAFVEFTSDEVGPDEARERLREAVQLLMEKHIVVGT
ncbi:hypothetical protein [Streptacidiphilus neutrinimicus]|uniref:hypothetical protein n=1 Tax=Streptacidiphilus neutrinimicus TaxID=105420 RepID=UPI0005A833A6|nr:hypothetical protein [Streptacidiphilus neutrinimicus]